MLTSTIVESKPTKKEIPFPKVMKIISGSSKETLVAFSKEGEGVVIVGRDYYESRLFIYSDSWEMSAFEDIEYPLTIEFKQQL